MVDDWCGPSNGRLIPLTLIPLWDADLAAAEVRRNAERGVRAVCFSEIPPYLGLPSIHDAWYRLSQMGVPLLGVVVNGTRGS